MQTQQQTAAPPQREMEGQGEGMKSMMTTQVSLRDLHQHQHHNQNGHFHDSQHSQPQTQDDDFMEQMLSTINPDCANSWPPPHSHSHSHALLKSNAHSPEPSQDPDAFAYPFNPATTGDGGGDNSSSSSSSKLRHPSASASPKSSFFLHQHLLLSHSPAPSSDSPAPLLPTLPLTLAPSDVVHPSPQQGQGGEDGSVPALYNGFVGSLHGNAQPPSHHHQQQQQQHFHHPSQDQGGIGKNYGGQATAMMNPDQTPAPPTSASTGGSSGAPQRQRVRARRGQATDPHSIAERLRRERIAERMKALQELVPNANKTDKASMLDEIIDYVKFLQLQVKVLSMSRLGGAAAIAPLGADMSSEGGGGLARNSNGNNNINGNQANESMTVTEHQVAKLMEEDMGSAMQYLQGKGLCLMPISLATAISTATCQSTRNPLTPTRPGPHINGGANANVNANDSTNTNTNPQLNMNINMSSSASADQLPSIKDNIANNPSSTSTKP